MAVLYKCILGLFAVLCLMQCVEMARMRREDDKAGENNIGGIPGLSGTEIGSAIDALVLKLRSALDDDTLKDVIASATKVISEGTKKLQEHIDSMKKE